MSGQHTPGRYVLCAVGDYGDYEGRCSVILERNEAGDLDRRAAVVLGDTAEDIALARVMASATNLLETLEMIADFAPGNGDVCEIIARRARDAIFKATSSFTDAGVGV